MLYFLLVKLSRQTKTKHTWNTKCYYSKLTFPLISVFVRLTNCVSWQNMMYLYIHFVPITYPPLRKPPPLPLSNKSKKKFHCIFQHFFNFLISRKRALFRCDSIQVRQKKIYIRVVLQSCDLCFCLLIFKFALTNLT